MKIDLRDHAEFGQYLQMGLKAVLAKALISTATRIVQDITTEIIPGEPRPPVDRGTYRGAWRVEAHPGAVHIVNNTKQAGLIERGVRSGNVKPGRAMIDALAAWVRRKGIAVEHVAQTKASKVSFLPTSANPYRKAAWGIAKAMKGTGAKPGTGIFKGTASPPGFRILARAMKKFDRYFPQEFARELQKVGGR